MALSDFEQRQLEAIERGLASDDLLKIRRLWPPHTSVIWVGIALGVVLSVLINVFSRGVAAGLFIVIGVLLVTIVVFISRYTRSR